MILPSIESSANQETNLLSPLAAQNCEPCAFPSKALIAFKGNANIKFFYQIRLARHLTLGQFVHGCRTNGKDPDNPEFRGSAVGCTLHSNDTTQYESELGIPHVLACLEEGIYEGLPLDEAAHFAARFIEAIPIGADLSGVFPRFMYWLLADRDGGVVRSASERGQVAIENVAALFARQMVGEEVSRHEWQKARDDAAAAADAAYAEVCADGTQTYAADDAAQTAACAALAVLSGEYDKAAEAEAYAAAAEAANFCFAQRIVAREHQATKLLELMQQAPVPSLYLTSPSKGAAQVSS